MNGAFSLITIVLLGCWGLAFSVASAFIVGSIQTQQHTTTNCRTATTTEHRYCNVVPEPRGLHRMASSTTSSELSDSIPDKTMEEVWRYAKKPLISVGGKGATKKHGNSLRQLLDDHTVVKVKVNTKSFGTLENAYERLRELTVESGASQDIELIQMREKERTIMFGLPGTVENVKNGSFPPAPVEDDDDDAAGNDDAE